VKHIVRRLSFNYQYFRQPPWDTGVSPPELFEFIRDHPPGRAMDVGCGTGTNVITLARAGWDVTGVDFAPRAIKIAKQKAQKAGVQAKLLVRDATKLHDIPGPFDLAFDLGCFHGIPQDRRGNYLEELNRILAPGGFWLMYGFLKEAANPSGTGLAEADLARISTLLALRSRRDGIDDGRARPSAWLLLQKGKMDVSGAT
jgi:SAM-dependent methyltransferase